MTGGPEGKKGPFKGVVGDASKAGDTMSGGVGSVVDRFHGAPSDREVEGMTPVQIQRYRKKARRVGFLSLLIKIGIVILAIVALIDGNMVWVFAGLFALFFAFVPTILKRQYQISIPWVLEFLIFLALFLHTIGGVLGLYDYFENWDTMTHFISTFMLGIVSLTVIYLMHTYWDGLTMDVRAIMVFTIFVAAFLGVIWEVMEWSVDQMFGTSEQHGLDDTMKDLVMDMVGAMIAAMLGAKWIVDGTMWGMTADFGDSLNKRVFEHVEPSMTAKVPRE